MWMRMWVWVWVKVRVRAMEAIRTPLVSHSCIYIHMHTHIHTHVYAHMQEDVWLIGDERTRLDEAGGRGAEMRDLASEVRDHEPEMRDLAAAPEHMGALLRCAQRLLSADRFDGIRFEGWSALVSASACGCGCGCGCGVSAHTR